MKSKEEIIADLLEMIDGIEETLEDATAIDSDFLTIQHIIDHLREEIAELYDV